VLAASGWSLVLDARSLRLARSATSRPALTRVQALPGDVSDPEHRKSLAESISKRGA
jgi:hypothetical protein